MTAKEPTHAPVTQGDKTADDGAGTAPQPARRRHPAYLALVAAVCLVTAASAALMAVQLAPARIAIPEGYESWDQHTVIEPAELSGVTSLVIANDSDVTVRVDPTAKAVTVDRSAVGARIGQTPLDRSVTGSQLSISGNCQPSKAGYQMCAATLVITVPPSVTVAGTQITSNYSGVTVAGPRGKLVVQGAAFLDVSDVAGAATLESSEAASVSGVRGTLSLTAGGLATLTGIQGTASVQADSIKATEVKGEGSRLSGGEAGVQAIEPGALMTIDSAGPVLVSRPGPGLTATSSGGAVTITAPLGSVTAETVSSALTIDGTQADVTARTQDGDITVTTPSDAPAAALTALTSGQVVATAPQDPAASRKVTLTSETGAITYTATSAQGSAGLP